MKAEVFKLGWLPAPLFQHLAWHLAKIYRHATWAVEAGVLGLGHEVMDSVPKLVKDGDDIEMPEQAGLFRCWFGKRTE